jgi:hypothetical protein
VHADAAGSSLPLGLALGLIFLAIIAITIAISMAVYLKVRKTTFHMQRNRAYHGATVTNNQDVVMAESTILYIYPAADNDESERSTTAIITERNEAYETEGYDNPLQNLELTYAEVDTVDRSAGARNSSSRKDQGRQSVATTRVDEDNLSQNSLEFNKAYGIAKSDNAYYESMTGSGTVEKYDYVQN